MSSNVKKLLEGNVLILKFFFIQLVTLKVVWFSREISRVKKKKKKKKKIRVSSLSKVWTRKVREIFLADHEEMKEVQSDFFPLYQLPSKW